jgi:hypothetical protein
MQLFNIFTPPSTLPPEMQRFQQRAFIVGLVALLVCIIGAVFNPAQFFRSYLLAYTYWLGVVLGCLAIVMIYHLTGGAWGLATRRLLESATRTLPVMILLFAPVAFGTSDLYVWTRPDIVAGDALLQHKAAYLNVPFFLVRAALYFLAWCSLAYFLNTWSLEEDQRADDPRPTRRMQTLSGPGLVVYFLTFTFAAVDWLMSLEPHWYSTIFGAVLMMGQGINGFALVIITAALLADRQPLAEVLTPAHFQALAGLLLSFVMLWAYMAFAQWLLIWSGNLPEENFWYVHRLSGGWKWIGLLLILVHFALPFLLLLSRDLKRNARALSAVAAALMIMRLIDLFWIIEPTFHPTGFYLHWMDVVAPIGLGGIWLAMFTSQLGERPLVPQHDPNVQEALAYGHARH